MTTFVGWPLIKDSEDFFIVSLCLKWTSTECVLDIENFAVRIYWINTNIIERNRLPEIKFNEFTLYTIQIDLCRKFGFLSLSHSLSIVHLLVDGRIFVSQIYVSKRPFEIGKYLPKNLLIKSFPSMLEAYSVTAIGVQCHPKSRMVRNRIQSLETRLSSSARRRHYSIQVVHNLYSAYTILSSRCGGTEKMVEDDEDEQETTKSTLHTHRIDFIVATKTRHDHIS